MSISVDPSTTPTGPICRLARWALAVVLFGGACAVHALGLGEPRTASVLGQPLDVAIGVTGYAGEPLSSLRVSIARGSGDTIGVDGVTVSLVDAGGAPRIRLRTRHALREPVLVFPLRLEWEAGDVVREYVVLVDAVAPARSTAAAASPARSPSSLQPVTRPVPSLPAFADIESTPGGTVYGPVAAGDTLYGISARLASQHGLDGARLAAAIVATNPRAFVGGNADRLLAGAMLRVPITSDAIAAVRVRPARPPAPAASADDAAAVTPPAPDPRAEAAAAPPAAGETNRLRDMIAATRRAIAEEESRRIELTGHLERANQQIAGLLERQAVLDVRQAELEQAVTALESRWEATSTADAGAAPTAAAPTAATDAGERGSAGATASANAPRPAALAPATPRPAVTPAPAPVVATGPVLAFLGLDAAEAWPPRLEVLAGAALVLALVLALTGFGIARLRARIQRAAMERGRGREEEAVRQRIANVRDKVNEGLAANDVPDDASGVVVVDLDSVRDRRATG